MLALALLKHRRCKENRKQDGRQYVHPLTSPIRLIFDHLVRVVVERLKKTVELV